MSTIAVKDRKKGDRVAFIILSTFSFFPLGCKLILVEVFCLGGGVTFLKSVILSVVLPWRSRVDDTSDPVSLFIVQRVKGSVGL